MISFEVLQQAAKKIEVDGKEGCYSAAKLVGWEMATALLMTHVRRNFGSMETCPALPEIDDKVVGVLKKTLPAEYFQALKQGCELFYMSRAYALDNFSAFAVYYRNRLWPTLEHAWQADKLFKSGDPDEEERYEEHSEIINRILNAHSAHDAKNIAHEPLVADCMRERTDEENEEKMFTLITLKHDQHEHVRKTLKNTARLKLVEDSPVDSFWGRGPEWTGKDKLGRLWEKLRMERYGY